MQRKQCIEYNAQNAIHEIQCIEYNALNILHRHNIKNKLHKIQIKWMGHNAYSKRHRVQCMK